MHHAGAFAEHFGGADAAATVSQDIGGQISRGPIRQVAGRNLLDECGNIDMRGAGDRARRVKAIETARGFDSGLALGH